MDISLWLDLPYTTKRRANVSIGCPVPKARHKTRRGIHITLDTKKEHSVYDGCREVYVDDVKTGMGGATGNKVRTII